MKLAKSNAKFPEEQICDLIMAEYTRIYEEENPSNAKDFMDYIHTFTNRKEKTYLDMCEELYNTLEKDECLPQKDKQIILNLLEIIGIKLWKYSA